MHVEGGKDPSNPLKIVVDQPDMRKSDRLAREKGFMGKLNLSISDDARQRPDIVKFLHQKFILWGRAYVPVQCKDGTVPLIEISDGDYGRFPTLESFAWFGDAHRTTLGEFKERFNPMDLNCNQVGFLQCSMLHIRSI